MPDIVARPVRRFEVVTHGILVILARRDIPYQSGVLRLLFLNRKSGSIKIYRVMPESLDAEVKNGMEVAVVEALYPVFFIFRGDY